MQTPVESQTLTPIWRYHKVIPWSRKSSKHPVLSKEESPLNSPLFDPSLALVLVAVLISSYGPILPKMFSQESPTDGSLAPAPRPSTDRRARPKPSTHRRRFDRANA